MDSSRAFIEPWLHSSSISWGLYYKPFHGLNCKLGSVKASHFYYSSQVLGELAGNDKTTNGSLYYKDIMIVNDTPRVIRMTIVNDAPNCGVTYNHHSDNSKGVIYTIRVVNYPPREYL